MDVAIQPETQVAPEFSPVTPSSPRASWWALPTEQAWFFISLLSTSAIALFVRLVSLDELQNEIYGDIAIIYNYVQNIQAGKWPTYFDVSAGPLYHYLITPLIAITGPTYYGFKLASVIVSLGVLAGTYALSRRLLGDWFAVLATAIAAVSSWLLIFSRLGNSQILVPLLVVLSLWLVIRYVQDGHRGDLIASAVVSALGLYVYPQSVILPGVTFVTLACLLLTRPVRLGQQASPLARRSTSVIFADLGLFIIVMLLCALPFAAIVMKNLHGFLTGYIGLKIQPAEGPLVAFVRNLQSAALAFFTRGDINDRSNISPLPHVDRISSLLLVIGIIYWFTPRRIRWSPLLFVPLVLLQMPSVLVLARPEEVPSASRTLGAAPLVYILVASGLWWLMSLIARRSRFYAIALGGAVLVLMTVLNLNRYFDLYIQKLPYHNTPIGQTIAEYIDTLPSETHVYLVGCCWRDGMPEPKGIEYRIARPERLQYIDNPSSLLCDQLAFGPQPSVMIWSDQVDLPASQLDACRGWLPSQVYTGKNDLPAFRAAPVLVDRTAQPSPAAAGAPATAGGAPAQSQTEPAGAEGELLFATADYRGQKIGVRHSPIDIGQISDIFDGNPATLMRGASDNPLVIEMRFTESVTATTLSVTTGTMSDFRVTAALTYSDGSQAPVSEHFKDLPPDPTVTLSLPPSNLPIKTARVEIEYLGPPPGEGYHIHVRDLQLQ